MSGDDPRPWLIEWFAENSNADRAMVSEEPDQNYLHEGWIDSFQLINLVADIEEAFGISFDNDDFQDRSFATIRGLANIIELHRNKE